MNAIQARSQLKLECLQRELEAQITASTTSTVYVVQAQRPRVKAGRDDKNLSDEVLPKITDLSLQFVDLP